jgi:hypothetical protein
MTPLEFACNDLGKCKSGAFEEVLPPCVQVKSCGVLGFVLDRAIRTLALWQSCTLGLQIRSNLGELGEGGLEVFHDLLRDHIGI